MNPALAPEPVSRGRAAFEAWLGRLRSPLGRFYLVLGSALMARVAVDAVRGVWRIHSGELFAWRHLPGLPLYSTRWLLVEWLASLGAGLGMMLGLRLRLMVSLALLASIAGLSQRSSNQQALMLIVLAFLALNPAGSGFSDPRQSPNLTLVKSQLVIVYAFSALHKVLGGFLDGSALRSILEDSIFQDGILQNGILQNGAWWQAALPAAGSSLDRGLMSALSWAVILAESLLPVLLLAWPRLGVAVVALLHVSFAVVMPGVLPFGLLMLAMSSLFLGPGPAAEPMAATVGRCAGAAHWRSPRRS